MARRHLGTALAAVALAVGTATAGAVEAPTLTAPPVEGNIVRPGAVPFGPETLARLRAPAGFRVQAFATDLGNPRMMAVAPDGTVYVTRRNSGDLVALLDRDGDGVSDERRVAAQGLPLLHGITIHQGSVYLATDTELYVAALFGPGRIGPPQLLVDDLPDGGQHPNRTLAFGPDGLLYLTVGSTCNSCSETNPESATILRFESPTTRSVYARGLRNTIGFGWHPQTRSLWGMDHGSDWRGDDQPPEELNRIDQGESYGWPWCFADRQVDRYLSVDPPAGTTREAVCANSTAPALTYTAHSAPIGMAFYTGSRFPAEYRDDAFVAMRGSWNREQPSGYKVVRVDFENGAPVAVDDFLTGFLDEANLSHHGRVAGVATTPDGSLLVSEDTNGVIYRISYGDAAPAPTPSPAAPLAGDEAAVTRLYFASFLRAPDAGGLEHWLGRRRAGASLGDVAASFAASAEFSSRYGGLTSGDYVALVYRNVLGRAPDDAGLRYWAPLVESGRVSRGQVMLAFSQSAEFRALTGTA